MTQLNNAAVKRTARPTEILQFGSGNFLRGFVDWMVAQSNARGLTNAGVAVSYATNRPNRHDALAEQDGLYHVVLEGVKDGSPIRLVELVDVIQAIIDPFQDWNSLLSVICSPDLKMIVSNTTEAGIIYAPMGHDEIPDSFPALLTKALFARFCAGGSGLAIVPCELIENNGQTLKAIVLRHGVEAGLGEDFSNWVTNKCHFYDTLVDRIVAGYPEDAEAIHKEIGFEDHALVKGEYFSLWVIGGDDYLPTILPLDRLNVGVHFVPPEAIPPFRTKKVRVLNASHTALAQVGLQMGFTTVREAFEDKLTGDFVRAMVSEEVLPTIDEDLSELTKFAASILERFENPFLQHKLIDIELNSLAKWKARNLPIIVDRWHAGNSAVRSVFSLSALLVLYSGQADGNFSLSDDTGVIEFIRDSFDKDDLDGWVAAVISKFNLSDGLTPQDHATLAAEVAAGVDLILQLRMAGALRALV